jgi:hypothetical protein
MNLGVFLLHFTILASAWEVYLLFSGTGNTRCLELLWKDV